MRSTVLLLTAALGCAPRPPATPAGMVTVPAGVYTVGSGQEHEAEVQRVPLAAFHIDRRPALLEDLATFARDRGPGPLQRITSRSGQAEGLPATELTAEEADAFCASRGGRLPTEQEWEAAARGPEGRTYPWGDRWEDGGLDPGLRWRGPVGQAPGAVGPWGLEDMVGDLFHWTATEAPNPGTAKPEWSDPRVRVVKAGALPRFEAYNRATFRTALDADVRAGLVGVRCVVPVAPDDPNLAQGASAAPFDRARYHNDEATRQVLSALLHPDRRLPPLWERHLAALPPGARVADVGAGVGYLSFRLAERVGPEGTVLAVDIDPGTLAFVARWAEVEGWSWLATHQAGPDGPGLAEGSLDALYLLGTTHHVDQEHAVSFIQGCAAALRPGGELVLGDELDAPSVTLALATLETLGFAVIAREDYDRPLISKALAAAAEARGRPGPEGEPAREASLVLRSPP